MVEYILENQRESCRLEWAQSSCTRWIHLVFFSWATSLLSLSDQRALADGSVSDLSAAEKSSSLLNRVNCFISQWPGTWHVVLRTFFKDYIPTILLLFPYILARIAQPWLIREIVLYIQGQSQLSTYAAYLYAAALCVAAIVYGILHQQIEFQNTRVGMRVQNALACAIYKHLLTVSTTTFQQTTAAHVINLITNDTSKFQEFCFFAYALLLAPMEAAATFILIWWYIGLPAVFGFAVLVFIALLQLISSRLLSRYRTARVASADTRVQAVHELVNGCQVIKMYNWEAAMEKRVRQARRHELSSLYKSSFLRAFNVGLFFAAMPLMSLATFGGSWLIGQTLQPANLFAVLTLFSMVRSTVTITMAYALEKLSEARVSARRIDQFMKADIVVKKREKAQHEPADLAIIIDNASFSWQHSPCLFNLTLRIQRGSLVGVKGAVGAGKSSLLAAVLGEMNIVNRGAHLYLESISYAPQVAWIYAGTVRANILLDKPMDDERYTNVIKACCLDIDLQQFGEVGDLLIIADKGVNLSGGQKARVSLARALYTDADLYLLDDPLAAVDPKVAKKIFDQCIGPHSLLRDKTRLFVTHHTRFLAEADQTVLLVNGRIEQFAPDESSDSVETNDSSEENESEWTLDTARGEENSMITEESSGDGTINWNVWFQLLTAPPLRWFGLLLLILVMFAAEALFDLSNYWLALWSGKSESEQRSSFYAYVYLGLASGTSIVVLMRSIYVFYLILRGSTDFHNRMLRGILYTSLRFFESNSSGRILNRASKDQQVLDEWLPANLLDSIQSILMTLGALIVIGTTNPWVLFILIPMIPSLMYLRTFYVRSSSHLRRLESVTRSPIYALFSSSMDGLTSIRAFHVEPDFVNMFMERIDTNARVYFILSVAARWLCVRVDLVMSLLVLTTTVLAIALRHQIDPSAAALSLSYCFSLTALFSWGVRTSAEVQNLIISAERLYEYGELGSEHSINGNESDILVQPPDGWPSRGLIEFQNYTLRYRPQFDAALTNLNLRIESKEKIGIVGRTGAGKSSVLQGLFRLIDRSSISGSILIDSIDISCLPLDYLRSRLSVIPQVPILFRETLRYNLDPFEQYTDEDCLRALEDVQLNHLVSTHPNGLHLFVAEAGTNLSAGERQLICLARAILKKSSILLIDEATAHVDYATDRIIQQMITDKFRDRTILTISHRLNTLANSDRILQLEHGEITYFDVPDNRDLFPVRTQGTN